MGGLMGEWEPGGGVFTSTIPAAGFVVTAPDVNNNIVPLITVNTATGGPFLFEEWSAGPQTDSTFNHWIGFGWNAGVQTPTGGNAGVGAMYMGIEDGFDNGGINQAEWYVAHWSPDHTSQQLFRPFYTAVANNNNATYHAGTYCGIGNDGVGFFSIASIGFTPIFTIAGSGAYTSNVPANLNVTMQSVTSASIIWQISGTNIWNMNYNAIAGVFALEDVAHVRNIVQFTAGATSAASLTEFFSRVKIDGLGAFAAGDKYVVADSNGNLHLSALGPAS
jgi:hypothetical protein